MENPELIPSCLETLGPGLFCRPDITDQAIENSEEGQLIDGSSFVKDGVERADYAIVIVL